MDDSCASSPGQQKENISEELVAQIAQQCVVLHSLRAWYAHAEPTIRLLDRGVAVKAHDLIVEGAIISTQLARKFGISLPDVSKTNWDLTPKTTGPGGPVQVEM